MSSRDGSRPRERSWTVAIYAGGHTAPIGSGVLIDRRRVLTCRHVVDGHGFETLLVAFPAAEDDPFGEPYPVVALEAAKHPHVDIAILTLAETAPVDVRPAPLRRPKSADVVGSSWWAFGFSDAIGNSADGAVGESLGYGWVRIDSESRYHLERGFSGAGLWSSEYEAVVAVVGQKQADNGDGRALTIHAAVTALPFEHLDELVNTFRLEDAGTEAAAEWGWQLGTDQEGRRHWRPRARGVASDAEPGWHFRGRRAALSVIVDWLTSPEVSHSPLAVTGSPGAGKSALLARVVTTADAHVASELPADDIALRAPVGSVACAVHAKGKTALEVAREVARAASAGLPDSVQQSVEMIRDGLIEAGGSPGRPFTVVVDALDEATSPTEARSIIRDVLRPLAESCADVGARVLVGTRRHDSGGELLTALGPDARVLDLDNAEFFDSADLTSYAMATLQMAANLRLDSPYTDRATAEPVATRVAEIATPNFLVAGLLARQRGLYDDTPVDPSVLRLDSNKAPVEAALYQYLAHMTGIGEVSPFQLFLPLAYAEAPGLDSHLWSIALKAMAGVNVSEKSLREWASGAAANFLIQTSDASGSFRLFHQSLNDTLIVKRDVVADQKGLTHAFLRYGSETGWASAPPYLWRSLPHHALNGQAVDAALSDLEFLLHADLSRLIPIARSATTPYGRRVSTLIRRTPQAITKGPGSRLGLLAMTDTLDGLETGVANIELQAPFRPRWAHSPQRSDVATLTGHGRAVRAICVATVEGRRLLATASNDTTVRLWDLASGEMVRELAGHEKAVSALCVFFEDGQELLASGGHDATVRLWDAATGAEIRRLYGHGSVVSGLCPVMVRGRELLASASYDSTIRIWDPLEGAAVRTLVGHTEPVKVICPIAIQGRNLLASGGSDSTVRVWDPATGEQIWEVKSPGGSVDALCQLTVGGREMLAVAGYDGKVRLLDPVAGGTIRRIAGHSSRVVALAPITTGTSGLLASAGNDGVIRLWNPATGACVQRLNGHRGRVNAACEITLGMEDLVASAGDDGTVRLWDLDSRDDLLDDNRRYAGVVQTMSYFTGQGRRFLVTGGPDRKVRLWNPVSGKAVRTLYGHTGMVRAVTSVNVGGQELLASGGSDRIVRLWDPVTGTQVRSLAGHRGTVSALCTIVVGARELLVSVSHDATTRFWDPSNGQTVLQVGDPKDRRLYAVCTVTVDGRQLLATAGRRGAIRLWNPVDGTKVELLLSPGLRRAKGTNAMCVVVVHGKELLVSGHGDGTIRCWDPATGSLARSLSNSESGVIALCPVVVNGRTLLASATTDRTVRLWDPATGRQELTIPLRDGPTSIASARHGDLYVGLDPGVVNLLIDI